jgi:hypothetical protein
MLEKDPKLASRMADKLHQVIDAVGLGSKVGRVRLVEVERFFGAREPDLSGSLEHAETHLARPRTVRSQPTRSPKH